MRSKTVENQLSMTECTDVAIIGSGFGASVAALRFSEAGFKVMVLERGGWISREGFEADDDMFWLPEKGRCGMNDFKKCGRNVIPWLGAGVGGGSHVYAATLKRREFFDDFPGGITVEEMDSYYRKAEQMMEAVKYPDYPPYNQLPAYRIFRQAEQQLLAERPDLVEATGDILLGISFAPPDKKPGEVFINRHGAKQRYSDPDEQKILGGDIEVKNSLDKNYLYLAMKKGAKVEAFREVTQIKPYPELGYEITWRDPRRDHQGHGMVQAKILICGAGAIGTTELLLRNKIQYGNLPNLSEQLGKSYFSNGDYVTFLAPKKGLLISWLGVILALAGVLGNLFWLTILGVILYVGGWINSGKRAQPDKGTTNSDYIRFKHRDGSTQGAYIEGGRYPTPIKAGIAVTMSLLKAFRPSRYKTISRLVNWMGRYVPLFELVERSWPIPMLMMGRDDAKGQYLLNEKGNLEIKFPFDQHEPYIGYLNRLGRLFARKAKSYFIPNAIAKIFKIIEVPHNLGGALMGESIDQGVVDTYGRVYQYDNFVILDGSIIPASLGPNPANTILALAERGCEVVIKQFQKHGKITAG